MLRSFAANTLFPDEGKRRGNLARGELHLFGGHAGHQKTPNFLQVESTTKRNLFLDELSRHMRQGCRIESGPKEVTSRHPPRVVSLPHYEVMSAICAIVVPDDGLTFDSSTVLASRIKEDQEYEGVRITCPVRLGNARLQLQIDVGFGDAITPGPIRVNFPTILDFPAPVLNAYPKETVVAEKFQAMTALGMQNSRMKDFFDLWILSRDFEFNGETLVQAINATFRRRRSLPPAEMPLALTTEFGSDPTKITQWEAFVRKGKLATNPAKLNAVIAALAEFLMPPSRTAAAGEVFSAIWRPGGPWETIGE